MILPRIGGVPASKITYWNYWLSELSEDWRGEVPLRLHENRGGGLGYAPPFTNAFSAYIGHLFCGDPTCEECRKQRRHQRANPESRVRVTRAFRRLRRVAPKEFDVLYSVAVLGFTLEDTARRLNERNEDKGRPERYNLAAVTILLASGIDKASWYYSL